MFRPKSSPILIIGALSVLLGLSVTFHTDWFLVVFASALAAVLLLILLRNLTDEGVSIYEAILIIVLISGPPRIRERDPMASLRGEIDWVVFLNAVIWTLAALWVFYYLMNAFVIRKKRLPRVHWLQKLGLAFAVALGLSTLVSPAPTLTAFRVFQIVVMILFGYVWIHKYGAQSMIKALGIGYIVMGLSIVLSAAIAPELVYAGTRLRGDYIANAGAIGVFGLVTLLSNSSTIRSPIFTVSLSAVFLWTLIASRTRSAYGAFLVIILLLILNNPRIYRVKVVRYVLIGLIPLTIIYHDFVFSFLIREPGSLATLSDRTVMWGYLFDEVIRNSPFLGLGFYAERALLLSFNPGIGTAHGAFPAVFGGAGFLGATVYLVLLVGAIYLAIRLFLIRSHNPMVVTAISLFAACFIIGIVTEEMLISTPTGFTFYMSLSLLPELAKSEGVHESVRNS
jgi:hypothetical protein